MADPARIDQYEIVRPLGEGGMGEVYQAWDPVLARMVAIKVLKVTELDPAQRDEFAHRLLNEARVVAQLEHPGIVMVHGVGQYESAPYMAMQYVDGVSLDKVLTPGVPFAREEMKRILRDAADALDHAHQAGVIHRDIKPENIMVAKNRAVKICDFGIAKSASVPQTKTTTGILVGSMRYLSPEQLMYKPASPRSDQWALGVVAYQMLAGRLPFEGDDLLQLAGQILYGQVPAVDSPAVTAVLANVLAKEPGARFGSCSEFVVALGKALELPVPLREPPTRPAAERPAEAPPGFAEKPPPPLPPEPAPQAPPSRPSFRALVERHGVLSYSALVAVLVATGFVVWWWKFNPNSVKTRKAEIVAPERSGPPAYKQGDIVLQRAPNTNGRTNEGSKNGRAPNDLFAGTEPIRAKVNPRDGLTYVWIPGGSAELGCPVSMPDNCGGDPPHRATMSGFWLCMTEVTVGAYRKFSLAKAVPLFSHQQAEDHPVAWITQEEARRYCGWIGGKLPSSNEWEYAAQGGYGKSYTKTDLASIAWYRDNANGTTHAVGQKAATGYGLFDMFGNVSEWMADPRITRGSSIEGGHAWGLSTFEWETADHDRNPYVGFRCTWSGQE